MGQRMPISQLRNTHQNYLATSTEAKRCIGSAATHIGDSCVVEKLKMIDVDNEIHNGCSANCKMPERKGIRSTSSGENIISSTPI